MHIRSSSRQRRDFFSRLRSAGVSLLSPARRDVKTPSILPPLSPSIPLSSSFFSLRSTFAASSLFSRSSLRKIIKDLHGHGGVSRCRADAFPPSPRPAFCFLSLFVFFLLSRFAFKRALCARVRTVLFPFPFFSLLNCAARPFFRPSADPNTLNCVVLVVCR